MVWTQLNPPGGGVLPHSDLQVYEKVGKSVISVCKKAQTVLLVHFMALKKSRRLSGFVMHS